MEVFCFYLVLPTHCFDLDVEASLRLITSTVWLIEGDMVGLAARAISKGEAFGATCLLSRGVECHLGYDDGLLDPDIS